MSTTNPLAEPPFTIIPGVSPTEPISAQVEQIDQLNTLLLQEIDANFAKFHTVITSKVLPEFKRFAIASEPTREAAQFWHRFFIAASAVPSSSTGDTTTTNETRSELSQNDETIRLENDSYLSQAQAEGSFMFHNDGPVSSTPLPSGRATSKARRLPDESYDDSLESPFDAVERKLGRLDLQEESDAPTPSLPSGYTLPGLDMGDVSTGTVEQPDLPKHMQAGPSAAGGSRDSVFGGTTPKANPSRAPSGSIWNGITDLRTTPLHAFKFKPKRQKPKQSLANTLAEVTAMASDLDEEIPMSPPVTTSWNLPARTQAVFNVGRTPVKTTTGQGAKGKGKEEDGARRILDDLMEEMERGYVPSPRMPTPDGLRRYSVVPEEIQGKRLFGDGPVEQPSDKLFDISTSAPAGRSGPTRTTRRSVANTSYGSDIIDEAPSQPTPIDDSLELEDDDSIELDSMYGPTTTIPQVFPSGHQPVNLLGDESFDSSNGGSPRAEMDTQGSEAGVIFGSAEARANQGRKTGSGAFSLHKQDEMSTFHGGKLLDAAGREVRHSPLAVGRGDRAKDGDLFAVKKIK